MLLILPLEEDSPNTSNSAADNPAANEAEIPPHPAPFENWRDVHHVRRASKRFNGEQPCPFPFLNLFTRRDLRFFRQIVSCAQSYSSEPQKWKHAPENNQDNDNGNIHSPSLGRRGVPL